MNGLAYKKGLRQELPCEYAVRAIFPSIRSSIARVLLREYGVSKYTIAKILGLSPAAVTFYIEGRRGDKYVRRIEESPELLGIVKKAAKLLLDSYNEKGFTDYSLYQVALCSVCSKVNEIAVDHGCHATSLKVKLIS